MKAHTQYFKDNICLFGRQLDSKITYTINNQEQTLTSEDLNSISPHYEGNILKSVMRQLDIDSNVEIPLNTEINYKFGCAIGEDENGIVYEYIDFGNYIVYQSEKNEDTENYKITCYDKMLYSMIDYESLGVTYPITIRDYIQAICTKLGLTFKNSQSIFANYNQSIDHELYLDTEGNSLGYTFRDVLDELAQVTASTICINEVDDELEIRYINTTNDTIDEEYLNEVNVKFGTKYGPINSIVLSRSADSDTVYLQDTESIELNGLCEIKIKDNQIMNFNNRADFLPDILDKLGGLQYYINDFVSTGICYYNLCDRYSISIGEQLYSCVMFNDDIQVTQGLKEIIYTDMPEENETDYTKSDKTDMRINQTYMIVDKQNQIIESVVSNVTDQNNKISQVTQTVDELNSKISDIADITISGESEYATFTLDNINQSEPIMIRVKPVSENISYLYPRSNLYPSSTLFSTNRKIRFENLTTNEIIDYELPDDLLYYDSENYDEFYLSYDSQTCQVTKRCKYNADGTVGLLSQEETTDYSYPLIQLQDGNYRLSLLGYQYGYLFMRLMTSNIYTSQFAIKSEVTSQINQTAQQIDASVNQKLTNYSTTTEMNSAITIKANQINSTVSEVQTQVDTNTGDITTNTNNISTLQQTTTSISQTVTNNNTKANIVAKINDNTSQVKIEADSIDLNGVVTANNNFKILSDGSMEAKNGKFSGTISGGKILINENFTEQNPYIHITHPDSSGYGPKETVIYGNGITCFGYMDAPEIRTENDSGHASLIGEGVEAFYFNNLSLAEKKEDFELLKSGLDIIKNIDIYKYKYKNQKENKKHIGLVIGDNYKYSKEITSSDNKNVDLYSFIAVCCKAIQEQQEQINELQKRIERLESEK